MSKRKAQDNLAQGKHQKVEPHPIQSVLHLVLYYIPKPEYVLIRQVCKFTRDLIKVKKIGYLNVYQTHNGNYWIPYTIEFLGNYIHYNSDTLWNFILDWERSRIPIQRKLITIAANACIKTTENYELAMKIVKKEKFLSVIKKNDTFLTAFNRNVVRGLVLNGLKIFPQINMNEFNGDYFLWSDVLTQVFKSDDLELIDYYCDTYRNYYGGDSSHTLCFESAIRSGNFKSVVLIYNRLTLYVSSFGRPDLLTYVRQAAWTNDIKMSKLVTYMCYNIERNNQQDSGEEMKDDLFIKNYPLIIKVFKPDNTIEYTAQAEDEITKLYQYITEENYEHIISLLPDSALEIDVSWEPFWIGGRVLPGIHNGRLLCVIDGGHERDVRRGRVSMEVARFFFEKKGAEVFSFEEHEMLSTMIVITKEITGLLVRGYVDIVKFCYEIGYYTKEHLTHPLCISVLINGNYVELLELFKLKDTDFVNHTYREIAGFIVPRFNRAMEYVYKTIPELVTAVFTYSKMYASLSFYCDFH